MSPIAQIVARPRGYIGLVGVSPGVRAQLEQQLDAEFLVAALAGPESLLDHMENGRAPMDAIVIDLPTEEAVRLAQRIHTYDKLIPVFIISTSLSSEELKRTLMFSPFVGNEVIAWSKDDVDILPATLRDAVNRHRQRVKHRNTLSTAQIRLEKLPLQRPEATHYLDRLLDHAPVGVMTVDLNGTVITSNKQAHDILATSGDRVLGQPLTKFFPASERTRLHALQHACEADASRHGSDVFTLHSSPDQTRYVEVSLAPLAYRTGQRGFMLILQDVTSRTEAEQERQRAEADLRHHAVVLRRFHEITSSEVMSLEEKIDEVLNLGCEQFHLPVGVLSRVDDDVLTIIRSVGSSANYAPGSAHPLNQTYCSVALRSPEPLAMSDASCDAWDQHPAYRATGQRAYIGTCVQVDDGIHGTLCFFSTSARKRPFNSADSELIKLMARWIVSELQRERADALMRKLSGALERTADAIMITDRDRFIEYVNPSFERLTGYSKEEAIGKKTYFLRSGLHDKKFYDELWNVIGKGEAYRGIMVNRKKDGNLYYEQKTISPLRDENGTITHFISTGHDISDLIEAEEKNRAHQAELAHVARLSTLGEMTSGLAHELNQPLCAITTYAQTCLHILQGGDCSPERVRYGVEQIVRQAELASEIFRRLRDFSRKGEIRHEPVCVAGIVAEVVELVAAEAQQKLVRLHQKVPAGLRDVMADRIQIEQVLLNLVRNAIDAVIDLDQARREILINVLPEPAGWITVEIKDQGPGCPQHMTERLFEPFVTTKDNGLGIGLSISHSIVEAHGGCLWLAENSEEGATFRFTLPTEMPS
ncbi:MAG: PAS domain S-box protein [Gammaproteobacteria bacterium]|nr:PAS domain S-box protein [Gammaproteobacteria bacterium]